MPGQKIKDTFEDLNPKAIYLRNVHEEVLVAKLGLFAGKQQPQEIVAPVPVLTPQMA